MNKLISSCVHWLGEKASAVGRAAKPLAQKAAAVALAFTLGAGITYAQGDGGVDFSAGTTAITSVNAEIAKYIPIVRNLCYVIAGVISILGAISVYISMNNEEQDVKKKIMMVVGACLFFLAAATALPMFFGY